MTGTTPQEKPTGAEWKSGSPFDSGIRDHIKDLSMEEYKRYFTPPTAEDGRNMAEWYQKYMPQATASMEWMQKLISGDESLSQLMTEFPMKDSLKPEVWQAAMARMERVLLEWAGEKNPTIRFGLLVDDALKHEDPSVAKFAQNASGWMSEATKFLSEKVQTTTRNLFK